MRSWFLLTLVVALFALLGCQEAVSLYDFDEDGSLDGDDCAPSDPLIHPGADDPYGDGIDQNCDGVDGNAVDLDGDGYSNAVDCDDNDPDIHPGAEDEPGDGIDSDCDDLDGVAVDLDGDGYSTAFDCDDSDPTVYPGAPDTEGDGVDQNCDGVDGVAPTGDDDDDSAGDDDDDSASGDDDSAQPPTNSPPSAPTVVIYPAVPNHNENLLCVVEVGSSDGDGDAVSYTFTWYQDGTDSGLTAAEVEAQETNPGEVWQCKVFPSDGQVTGEYGLAEVTIAANQPPSAPVVLIAPSVPITTDDLVCLIDTLSVDPEGEAVTYSFAWEVDGSPTAHTTGTVPSTDTLGDQLWTCTVTPQDSGGDGVPGDASATIDIPVGCGDGTVEAGGVAIWGRADIVFCAIPSFERPTLIYAGLHCGSGWHVCTSPEFTSRNDTFVASGPIYGVLDDGANCSVIHSNPSGFHASSDLIYNTQPGSCTGSLGSPNSGVVGVGRWATPDNCDSVTWDCGVMCCYD